MWAKLRDWYIVVIAACLISGGFFFASHQPSPSAAIPTVQESASPKSEIAVATQRLAPSPPARAAEPPHSPAGPVTAASIQRPATESSGPPTHDHAMDHTMAVAAAETSAPTRPATAAAPTAGGDAAAGRLVFRKCQACHSMEPGKTILGPSLAGIMGRKAGSDPGYNYSPSMKQANIVWDAKTLDAYLSDPQKVVPGNKMPFPRLKTDHDRADVIAYFAAPATAASAATTQQQAPATTKQTPPAAANQGTQGAASADAGYSFDAKYTLRSGIADGRMVYLGVGGAIDGKVNPVLTAAEGQVVELTLINGEGAEHDIVFPDQNSKSPRVTGKGASTTIAFRAEKAGDFIYFCSVPGHQLAGMQGQFIVTTRPAPQTLVEADISREPTDLPPPIGKRDPQTVRVDLFSVEVEAIG
jgi:nitrite reductase (NO-forming)